MKRYISLLSGGSFIGDTAITFITSLSARLITLASMAAITRIYDSSEYGVWVLLLAFANFFLTFTNFRYDIALILAPTQRMANGLFVAILAMTLITIVIVLGLVTLSSPTMLSWMTGLPPSSHQLILFAPCVLATIAIQFLLQTWSTRQRAFKTVSVAIATQAIVTALSAVLLPLLIGATAIAAGTSAMAGNLTAIGILAWQARHDLRLAFSGFSPWPVVRKSLYTYRVYPLFTLPYSLSVILTERIIQVTLASAFSVSLVGAYFVARQLMQAPVTILTSSIRNVLVAHGAREQTMDRTRLRVEGLLTSLMLVVAPGLAYGVVWLEPTIAFTLGSKWPLLPQIAWWCMFPAGMLLFSGPLDRMPDMVGRQKLSVGMQLTSDIIMLSIMFICIRQGMSALTTIAAISVTLSIYNAIWLVIILNLIGSSLSHILSLFGKFTLIFVGSFALQFGLHHIVTGNIALLIGGIVMLISCGVGLIWLARSVMNDKSDKSRPDNTENLSIQLNGIGDQL